MIREPLFSMIIATINRPEALLSCLNSIFNQKYSKYEIIIIDQSDDKKSEKVALSFNDKRIIYEHVNFRGLSRARNYGLKMAHGDYFCLIDDDAFYDEFYLFEAVKHVAPKRILSGYIYDTINNRDFVKYKNRYDQRNVTLRMIMRQCPSAGLIIPMNLIQEVGFFDENFGVGSRYGSGEESDLLLRSIKVGYKVMYIKDSTLKHPVPIPSKITSTKLNEEKRALYFEGTGALYKKHMCGLGMKKLILCYIEIILKFFVKAIITKGERRYYVKMQYESFLRGFKEYEI